LNNVQYKLYTVQLIEDFMARRADHTREELKEIAIKAGLELIKKEGFFRFSARKLATRIGYTVGTLYNVFGSYDGLIVHINGRTLDAWFVAMQAALEKRSQKSQLHKLALAYIDYSKNNYQQWIALFEYHTDEGYELPDWYMEKMARFFALAEEPLLPLVGNNRRKARRAARVLWAGIHGICILSSSGKLDLVDADSAETLAISFIGHYTTGLSQDK
jgi:AcrR family transcriptional regulator